MTIQERFDKFDDDSHKFERVVEKRSKRMDLHAFMLLDEMFPGTQDMVCGAEHDEIFLSVDLEQLHLRATDDQIQELRRCGVFISIEYGECLSMFV